MARAGIWPHIRSYDSLHAIPDGMMQVTSNRIWFDLGVTDLNWCISSVCWYSDNLPAGMFTNIGVADDSGSPVIDLVDGHWYHLRFRAWDIWKRSNNFKPEPPNSNMFYCVDLADITNAGDTENQAAHDSYANDMLIAKFQYTGGALASITRLENEHTIHKSKDQAGVGYSGTPGANLYQQIYTFTWNLGRTPDVITEYPRGIAYDSGQGYDGDKGTYGETKDRYGYSVRITDDHHGQTGGATVRRFTYFYTNI